MISARHIRIALSSLAAGVVALVSFLSVLSLAAVGLLGLPAQHETAGHYARNACRLVQATLDPHLPCREDAAKGSDRQALWSVIQTACLPASYFGLAFPCVKVNRERGYAVLRYPAEDRLDFVVAPTDHVPGMESLIAPHGDAWKLWRAAWDERGLLEQASTHKLNWADVIVAVNSKSTRSQDQLHIHFACIDPSLRDFLAREPLTVADWRAVRPAFMTTSLFVRLLPEEDIDKDIFAIVFDDLGRARSLVEKETIAVAGVVRGGWRGFALMVTLEATSAEQFMAPNC
jgi:CDP-diacylglycerol pyrophosphatase